MTHRHARLHVQSDRRTLWSPDRALIRGRHGDVLWTIWIGKMGMWSEEYEPEMSLVVLSPPYPLFFIYFCSTSGGVASIHSSTECHTRCRCYCDTTRDAWKLVTTHELGSCSCRLNHECTVVLIQLFSLHRYNVVTSPYFELTECTQLKATRRNARLMPEHLSDREKVFFVRKQGNGARIYYETFYLYILDI